MPIAKRECLFCGKIIAGRPDKKYCNDVCRTGFSNELKGKEHKEIRTISLALKKNRNILKKLRGDKDFVLISEENLLLQGFLFDYHTHYFISGTQQNKFTFCFDYGYREMGNKRFKIIRRW